MKTGQAVLVTTEYKGVFFGLLGGDTDALPKSVTITDARNCIYWSADVGGFLGLAATGPNDTCRIGAKVDELTLFDVTSITPVTDGARDAWLNA